MTQSAGERLGEIHSLKRFMQHLSRADGGCTLLECGAPVAAHQDDRNIRPQESNLASSVPTRSGIASSVSTKSKRSGLARKTCSAKRLDSKPTGS
jgi:L-asparaginase II